MRRLTQHGRMGVVLAAMVLASLSGGCARWYRQNADEVAYRIIEQKQAEAMGRVQPFTIEPAADVLRRRLMLTQDLPYCCPGSIGSDQLPEIPHWPEEEFPPAPDDPSLLPGPPQTISREPVLLTLQDALAVAARNNRTYQTRKEDVFSSALNLDLEEDDFRATVLGQADATIQRDLTDRPYKTGMAEGISAELTQRFKSGVTLTGRLGLDLVRLLSTEHQSSMGLIADATITVPLLRGAGMHIVTEPITQAERNVVYAIFRFERYRKTLAVQVAREYLGVLRQMDEQQNALDNYRRLIAATRRARNLADAGRLEEIQVDQARQDELRARNRWITAMQSSARQLDSFKDTLGLPADAEIKLDPSDLQRMADRAREVAQPFPQTDTGEQSSDDEVQVRPPDTENHGPLEIDSRRAIELALQHRLDLRTQVGEVYDAQRNVVITADALKMGLDLTASGALGSSRGIGSTGSEDARLNARHGLYTAGVSLDLPTERTAEQKRYRESYIQLEQAVRNLQELEDNIKRNIRESLRTLLRARESIRIQVEAARLARRRVESTELFLLAGRAQIRDVLEAQEALVNAQNALTSALVDYRVAELELQRDMGVMEMTPEGLWKEFVPAEDAATEPTDGAVDPADMETMPERMAEPGPAPPEPTKEPVPNVESEPVRIPTPAS